MPNSKTVPADRIAILSLSRRALILKPQQVDGHLVVEERDAAPPQQGAEPRQSKSKKGTTSEKKIIIKFGIFDRKRNLTRNWGKKQ